MRAWVERLTTADKPDDMSEEHWALEIRVAKGILWLTEHDPDGVFHQWFTFGLTARSPMPAQSEDRAEAWQAYYKQRVLWERLDAECRRLDEREKVA